MIRENINRLILILFFPLLLSGQIANSFYFSQVLPQTAIPSHTTITYSTLGVFTIVFPVGTTTCQVQCWGTGGSGGANDGSGYGSPGAGGGGFSQLTTQTVTAGITYTVFIGTGGQTVYFSGSTVLCLANCGQNSVSSSGAPDPAPGASGGSTTGAIGTIKTAGGSGGSWTNAYGAGGSGGGSGGASTGGGNGTAATGFGTPGVGGTAGTGSPSGATGANGTNFAGAGINGGFPGGGGSGSANFGSQGSGGNGQVKIRY
jgi:hypothetical protein